MQPLDPWRCFIEALVAGVVMLGVGAPLYLLLLMLSEAAK